MAVETTAFKNRIRGPAASSDAWPLDGPFTAFDRTPANEEAYYMHIAIRRAAAAVRARVDQEKLEPEEEEKEKQKVGTKREVGGTAATATASERGATIDAAVRAAVSVASSPALLYTRGEMGDEESLLRESLAVYRTDQTEKALR